MPHKVIAYIRVSTDKQDTDNQLYDIKRYLTRRALELDDVVRETVSGTKLAEERKLGQLMDELLEGDTLVVSELSRLSRQLPEVQRIVNHFVSRGVVLVAVKQNFEFDKGITSQVLSFAFGLAAQIERDMISARTKEALARKKAEGVKLGRPPGTFQQRHYKLHGHEAEIVAFLRADMPLSGIARYLHVHRETLRRFIHDRDLRRQVMEENGRLDNIDSRWRKSA